MGFKESLLKLLFGDTNQKQVKKYAPIVDQINGFESSLLGLSDDQLKQKTQYFKQRITAGDTLDQLLPEAFAVVREASKRVLKMRHFDVQLIGGLVLHDGQIAEMKTGEGKTLVSTLPAYLNALEGKGVYVVTVNDYLAKRDSSWMGKLFEFLGLTVGLIQSNMPQHERIKAYQADITYGTNNEFGFDYLRDHLLMDIDQCCQTRRHFAIIDEVDSILIDEARTPLIISGPIKNSTDKYIKVAKTIATLEKETDFTLEEKTKTATLTEPGIEKIEKAFGVDTIYSIETMEIAHMAVQCLRAKHLFKNEVDYVVKDGEVMIVDEFTGRILEGRRYSEGLHQAIEAMEGVKIKEESQTLASITYQNYFRLFPKLAGMTGTAATEAEEFSKIYNLPVVTIPTNKPVTRQDKSDVVYKTKVEKYKAIVKEIKELHEKGQPVLVGTISIDISEHLSKLLKKEGITHNVLNAKYHEREAEIISHAGQKGAVTIATNMAGRGTDIVLGDGVTELGGLYVIGSERHESRRIDNQLRGRSGRQGDPGETRFYVALDDDLMRLFGSDRIAKVMEALGMPDDTPIEHGMISKSIQKAQSKVEKYYFGIRKQILQYDDVISKQRNTMYALRMQLMAGQNIQLKVQEMLNDLIDGYISQLFPEGKIDWTDDAVDVLSEQLLAAFPIKNLKDIVDKAKSDEKLSFLKQTIFNFYLAKTKQYPPLLFDEIVSKRAILTTLDRKWIDHLHNMDILREGIGLRAYGQRDPLIEYKLEAFTMFKEMIQSVREEALSVILRAEIMVDEDAKQDV
jgi:preprotein translocase subunit SecA